MSGEITFVDNRIWNELKYFSPDENWGNPDKMDIRLLWNLDKIRDCVGKPFSINCGYEDNGHTTNSLHKVGKAVDLHVDGITGGFKSFYSLYLFFLNHWVGGIGIYPYWNSPGFHLDIGRTRTWVRDSVYNYHCNNDNIIMILRSIKKDGICFI